MLLLVQFAHNAADKIYRSIVAAEVGEKKLKPILRPMIQLVQQGT